MTIRALAFAMALAVLAVGPALAAESWKAQRNAWGQPDLSGVWTNATITTLERNPIFGDRKVLTEAEAKQLESGNATRVQRANEATKDGTKVDELPSCGGGQTGPACGYNNFWVDPGTKVVRIGAEARTSIIVEPKNGRLPLNPAAQARIRNAQGNARVGNFDGPERRPLGERCLVGFGSTSGPPMLPVLYNNHYQILQTGREVMIQVEMVHDTRIVRLNDTHKPASVREWMGDSIGRWEGDTLVVETIGLKESVDQTAAHSDDAKLIERYSIEQDEHSGQRLLKGEVTIIDPTFYSRPVAFTRVWAPLTNGRMMVYDCTEPAWEDHLDALRKLGQPRPVAP